MLDTIYFVESIKDINIIGRRAGFCNSRRVDSSLFIAMTVEAQAELKRQKLPYDNTLKFYGPNGHEAVLKKSVKIINEVNGLWNFQDRMGVKHAYEKTLFFYLRFYLNNWLLNLYIVDQVIRRDSPSCIYIPESMSLSLIKSSMPSCDNLLGLIIKQYVELNNLDIKIIEIKNSSFTFRYFLKKKYIFKHTLNTVLFFVGRIYKPLFINKKVILVADDSYNLSAVVKAIKEKDPDVFPVYLNVNKNKFTRHLKSFLGGKELFFSQRLNDNNPSSNLQDALDKLTTDINSYNKDSVYNYLGVDLRVALSTYISNSIINELGQIENSVKQIQNFIALKEPSMALSQHALGYSYALGEICSITNIPSLLITHGTHAVQKEDENAKIEWAEHSKTIMNAHFSHTAIQSPMAYEFFSGLGDKFSIGLKTGPLIYSRSKRDELIFELKERLIGKEQLGKKIIIHAGTPKGSNAIRPWVYETIDEYIRNINDLIDAVDCLHDVYLIVRFRASEGLNKKELSALLKPSKNYGVFSDGVFDDYLSISDLLISFSSTTIEEALQNDTVVLQYDHDDKYMHIRAPIVTDGESLNINPIYYCGHKDELENSIYMILKNIDLIKSEKSHWDLYRYPIDSKLEWFDELHNKQ